MTNLKSYIIIVTVHTLGPRIDYPVVIEAASLAEAESRAHKHLQYYFQALEDIDEDDEDAAPADLEPGTDATYMYPDEGISVELARIAEFPGRIDAALALYERCLLDLRIKQ